MRDQKTEILYTLAHRGWYCEPTKGPNTPALQELLSEPLIAVDTQRKHDMFTFYTITEAGKDLLKETTIHALAVQFPDQSPYILRDADELIEDVQAGMIEDTLSCWLNDSNDGEELFRVSIHVVDLYTLATLPEWEPI